MGLFDSTPTGGAAPAASSGQNPLALALLGGLGNPQRLQQQAANQRALAMAEALQKQGSDTSPIASPWQGVARLADTFVGNQQAKDASDAELARANYMQGQWAGGRLPQGAMGNMGAAPQPSATPSGAAPGPVADAGTDPSGNPANPMAVALANYAPAASDGSSSGVQPDNSGLVAALQGGAPAPQIPPRNAALAAALSGNMSSASYASPSAAPGVADTSGAGGMPSPDQVATYIAQSAQLRGIDPNAAVRVASAESRLNPAAVGDDGSSNGVFQLHSGGVAPGGNSVAGMADDFRKATGLDPTDPSTWRQQVDFALDQAKRGGWAPWHAAAGAGVGPMDGIGSQPQTAAAGQVGMPGGPGPYGPAAAYAPGGSSSTASPAMAAIAAASPVANSDSRAFGQVAQNGNAGPGISNNVITGSGGQSSPAMAAGRAVTTSSVLTPPSSNGAPAAPQTGGPQQAAGAPGYSYWQGSDGSIYQRGPDGSTSVVQRSGAGSSPGGSQQGAGASLPNGAFQGAQIAQPTPRASGMSPDALLSIMTSPYASPQDQQLAATMFQAAVTPKPMVSAGDGYLYDPNRGVFVASPGAGHPSVAVTARDGTPYMVNPYNPSSPPVPVGQTGGTGYRPATPQERAAYNVPPDAHLVFNPKGEPSILAGAGGDDSYSKPLLEGLGKSHASLADGVESAQSRVVDLNALGGAAQRIAALGGHTGGMGQQDMLDLKKTINGAAAHLGIPQPFDESNISDQEFLTKFNRTLAAAAASNGSNGGRVTNFAIQNMLKANPGLDLSDTGNQRLIGIQQQIENRNVNVGQAIRDATGAAAASGQKPQPAAIEGLIRDYDNQHHIMDPVTGQDLTKNPTLAEFQTGGKGTSGPQNPGAGVAPTPNATPVTLPQGAGAAAVYNSLPHGAPYIDPNGNRRTKP